MNPPVRRIVFVTSGLARGGAEAQLVYLAKELVRRGYVIAIYTLNHELDRLPELEGSGVQVRIDRKRMKLDIAVLFRLALFVRTFQADLVHGFLYDGNLYGCLVGWMTRKKVMIAERSDNYQLNGFQKAGIHIIRKLAHGLVANSHSGARFAKDLYKMAPERIHTVWNGIDLEMIDRRLMHHSGNAKQQYFGTSDVRVAILVGNIRPAKDYLFAIDVAAKLCELAPDWRVLFLGGDIRETGDYRREVEARHGSLTCRERVIFCDQREDAIEVISQCDVLFSTSVREGFPNVVLEAMSVGVPVISTAYSDIKEILPFFWQVIDKHDPFLMASAIEKAYQKRAVVALTQRSWVEANATIQTSADRFGAICDEPAESA